MKEDKEKLILDTIIKKNTLKQHVFQNTFQVFNILKEVLQEMVLKYNKELEGKFEYKTFAYKDVSDFRSDLQAAGDMLVFKMHTNVFEFDRDHGVWKISSVKKNEMSTYSGIINIYNFLADSFKYNRNEDLGYLIGRIFINKDKHYFVEGKRQMGFMYNDFGNSIIDKKSIKSILETAIAYSLQFDLLVPPYDNVKIVTVDQIQDSRKRSKIKTGKRLGFQFRSDDVKGAKGAIYTGG